MTWVSERSGTASSGVRVRARTPKPAATRTAATVNTGFRAQRAIRRAIMAPCLELLGGRTELALRGHQEVARGHDHFARPQAGEDHVVAAGPGTELDFSR